MDDRVYTKGQIFWGTMLGGPLSAIYFLRQNFLAQEDFERSGKTITYGLIFFLLLVIVIPFLPENIPSLPFAIAYAFCARAIYDGYQTSLADRPRYSHWRVTGISLLLIIPTLIGIFASVFIFGALGMIEIPAE